MTHNGSTTLFDMTNQETVHPQPTRFGKTPGARERFTRYRRLSTEHLDVRFVPTEQDFAILRVLAERRALTAAQVKAIVFPLQRSDFQCNHRLKLLYHYGYILRILPRQNRLENKPFINILDHAGARCLAQHLACPSKALSFSRFDRYLDPDYFDHVIDANWDRLWIERSAREAGIQLVAWVNEQTIKRTHKADIVQIIGTNGQHISTRYYADHYFLVQHQELSIAGFVETDRRTERLTDRTFSAVTDPISNSWAKKVNTINAYCALHKGQSCYSQRYGRRRVRVFTITTSQRRLAGLKQTTERCGGRERFWFTTQEYRRNGANFFTDPIWQIAGSSEPSAILIRPTSVVSIAQAVSGLV